MTEHDAAAWMGYREPDEDQLRACIALRSETADLAAAICRYIPTGPDQEYCLRKAREAMQASVAAICSPMPTHIALD